MFGFTAKKHIIKIVAFFFVRSMTCSFCGKNVTEFRRKFKKLSNNKTRSEKAASAFLETPTHKTSSFQNKSASYWEVIKFIRLTTRFSMHFRCEHNKSQRFQSTFYQKDARRFICIPWKRSDDDFHGGTSYIAVYFAARFSSLMGTLCWKAWGCLLLRSRW